MEWIEQLDIHWSYISSTTLRNALELIALSSWKAESAISALNGCARHFSRGWQRFEKHKRCSHKQSIPSQADQFFSEVVKALDFRTIMHWQNFGKSWKSWRSWVSGQNWLETSASHGSSWKGPEKILETSWKRPGIPETQDKKVLKSFLWEEWSARRKKRRS